MITLSDLAAGSVFENGQHRPLTAAEIQWANDYYYPKPKPAPAAPPKPPVKISKASTGVRKNTKTKNNNKNNMQIARSANIIPLNADAVGYSGLRIS